MPLATPLLGPSARKAAEQHLASASDSAEQAKATVARAENADAQAKGDLGRMEALAKRGSATEAQLDQASSDARMRRAELSSARFAERVAKHEIAQARTALARFTPGGTASPSSSKSRRRCTARAARHAPERGRRRRREASILELGDPSALELVADVLSQDAVEIRPGMAAHVVHWGGEGPLAARVRRVEPAAFTKVSALGVDEQRVNVLLDLEGEPETWGALGDGFSVPLEIILWSKPDVLQVPTSALFRAGDAWTVFIADGSRARARRVEVGHRGALQTEVTSGVQEGEVVIVHPGAAVHKGFGDSVSIG